MTRLPVVDGPHAGQVHDVSDWTTAVISLPKLLAWEYDPGCDDMVVRYETVAYHVRDVTVPTGHLRVCPWCDFTHPHRVLVPGGSPEPVAHPSSTDVYRVLTVHASPSLDAQFAPGMAARLVDDGVGFLDRRPRPCPACPARTRAVLAVSSWLDLAGW